MLRSRFVIETLDVFEVLKSISRLPMTACGLFSNQCGFLRKVIWSWFSE